ncbi:hypothetical protein JCM10207_005636 [Rhodosporidiobolus poonsookiae]
MPRSRRRDSFSNSSSSDSDLRRRPSRTPHRTSRSRPRKEDKRAYRSLDKRDGPPSGYREENGWDSDSSAFSSDSSRSRYDYPTPTSPPSAPQPQSTPTRRCLILFLGVAVGICLVLLGAYVLIKHFGFGESAETPSSGGVETQLVTVTVTASDGKVSASVSTSTDVPSSKSSAVKTTGSSTASASQASSSSSGESSGDLTLPGLSRNGIGIGWLPDYVDQKMSDLTAALNVKSSFYGWYAQLPASGDWDGSQLLSQMDDIKACNCIFQPAVMPTKGWTGLTADDNSQALAIAKVMKQFTDEGIEVWLRFAHEVNYYVTDGTYQGGVDDFKAGWAAVADAVKDNTMVKMFFTPNVAGSLDDYVKWMPDDTSTIDYLGIGLHSSSLILSALLTATCIASDYYPSSKDESFVDHMQPLYDKYCSDGKIKFAIGETGNGWEGDVEERLSWLDQCTSEETATAMPHYVGVSWFNYDKQREFRLYLPGDDSVNEASKEWLAEGTVASGATAGSA